MQKVLVTVFVIVLFVLLTIYKCKAYLFQERAHLDSDTGVDQMVKPHKFDLRPFEWHCTPSANTLIVIIMLSVTTVTLSLTLSHQTPPVGLHLSGLHLELSEHYWSLWSYHQNGTMTKINHFTTSKSDDSFSTHRAHLNKVILSLSSHSIGHYFNQILTKYVKNTSVEARTVISTICTYCCAWWTNAKWANKNYISITA